MSRRLFDSRFASGSGCRDRDELLAERRAGQLQGLEHGVGVGLDEDDVVERGPAGHEGPHVDGLHGREGRPEVGHGDDGDVGVDEAR